MDLTNVQVKEHPFYKGLLVRSDGLVKGRYGDFKKGWLNASGYQQIRFKGKELYIHKLVAEAFLENPNNLPTVDHKDRNKQNNHVENLRWASFKDQADNTANCDNPASPVRYCENSSEYWKWKNSHSLRYDTPEGKGSKTGFLYQDEYDQLKPLTCKERYFEYQRILDARNSKSRRIHL